MPLFNVSVISVAPLSGIVTVDAKTEQLAIEAARELHRRARVEWTNDGKRAGAYTGKVNHVWAIRIGPEQWRVSLVAQIPVTKVITVSARNVQEAEARARQDFSYLSEDDWRYQGRPISPIKGVLPPIDWSQPVSAPTPADYKPPTLSYLSIIPNPTTEGLATVFATEVRTNKNKPDGVVAFYETDGVSSTSIGTASVVDGNAVISIPAPSAGVHTYYAVYSGSDDFEASTTDQQSLLVGAVPTNTSVIISFEDNPYIMGESEVDIYATVNGFGVVTGTVDFYNGDPNVPGEAVLLGTEPLVNGVATFVYQLDGPGSIPVYGVYSGDVDHDPSTSAQATVVVVPEISITSVTPNSGSESGGNSVTIDGFGLFLVTDVTFNGVPATNVVPNGEFELTCDVPPGTGTADVVAFAYYGDSGTSGNGAYSYSSIVTLTPVFDEPNDIQWDGSHLWVTDKDNGFLSKVDPKLPTPGVVQIIDLSPYGISTANGGARSAHIVGGYVYVAGMFSGRVVAVEASTGDVVGICDMGANRKVASCAVDPVNNNLWVAAHQVGGVEDPGSHLGVFDIANMLAQFPTPVSPSVSYGPYARTDRFSNPDWVHFENIIYAEGYIWGGTGSWNLYAQLSRIDVNTGVRTYWENNNAFGLDFYYRVLYAHGSIWASSWDDRIYRFDPATFPSAPIATVEMTQISNAAMLSADSTSVWVVGWQWDRIGRISVGAGTEAQILQLTDTDPDVDVFQGIACTEDYGTWLTTRFSNVKSIVRVSTSPGSEAYDFKISTP